MTKKKLRDYYWKNTASSIYEYILFITCAQYFTLSKISKNIKTIFLIATFWNKQLPSLSYHCFLLVLNMTVHLSLLFYMSS